ncbi:polysaccharide pyruvyl transferase family protein [Diaphorobacter sp.]|uniref:polysaccharide pyruvyl transferase family protein n=1 Tax=Diaphorobacter sp. TaxID=1934310 RepID=UPI003D0C1F78
MTTNNHPPTKRGHIRPSGASYPDNRPTLIGFLPSLTSLAKTGANYPHHARLINSGDIAYTYGGALLTSGRNFGIWNFQMSPEEVNEKFSKVIFFLPCRIAPPPFDEDGYAFEYVINFIERLKIPFFSLSESIQAQSYEYITDLHKTLSPKVVRYLKTIADRSPIVGTRGTYSAETLSRLGIKNAVPLGCPSLFLNGPALKSSLLQPPQDPRRVAVCYSNYQKNPHSRIADFLQFAEHSNYHYIEQEFGLAIQALHYPGKISSKSIQSAKKSYQDLTPIISLLEKGLVHYFSAYPTWKKFMETIDFAFGARMHGLTPAIHAGKPAVFIAHDARVREMCEFFCLPFVAERNLPETLNINFFLSRCDYDAASKRYRTAYQNFLDTLEQCGLNENIDSDGRIIDDWTPEVDPQLAKEEILAHCTPDEIATLRRQVDMCENTGDTSSRIQAMAQEWYLARIARKKDIPPTAAPKN